MAMRRLALWAPALLAGLLFATSPALAQGADGEFRNGVAAFEEGRFEEAERHFRNVLKSRPGYEQALRYRDEAGYHFWVQVLARGGRLGTVAKRILKLAEEAAVRERQDPQAMRQDLRNLWSDDFMDQIEATERLVAKFGHYVVPELVSVLSDRREDEKIVRSIQLLARLGDEGTLALVELLESDDITLQQNAAHALGYTHDIRAIPALKRLAQESEDPHVREAAEGSISRISGPDFGTQEYYARIAEEFYRGNPLFLVNRYSEHVVWEWQNGRLTHRTVPGWRWNEEVAEEYVYEGLETAPEDERLWTLLLNIYAQEWAEIEESLRAAQMVQDRGGEVDEDDLEAMRAAQRELAKAKMLVASRGAPGVLSALGKALADQRAPVAVFLIERLQELDFDTSILSGGSSVTYLPPEEQPASGANTGFQQPSQPAQPSQPSQPEPRRVSEPPPPARDDAPPPPSDDPWEDDAPPPPSDDPWEDDAPPLDDDAPPPPGGMDDDAPPPPRRRVRRVSEGPRVENRVERFGYRGPVGNNADALGATGSTPEHLNGGAAFCAALKYGDKRVRYAAAIAAAHLNPPQDFPNASEVMVNLNDALGQSGQRVILVVERDRHNRNRIVGLLRELGYMAFGVESGRAGLLRSKSFPSEDMVIVSSELNPAGDGGDPIEIQFIDMLKDDYRTSHVKVMILAPTDRVSDMQTIVDEGRALDVIEPEIDRATLADKLTRAFSTPEDERDEKSRSDAIARRAALAIAQLDRDHTIFDLSQAAGPLAQNVKRAAGRPDNVRLACLQGLSAVGPAARSASLEILVSEFRDPVNPPEVRAALATAIGDVVAGQTISGDAFQVLKAALAEDNPQIWEAAGYALGKAQLTGPQALEVWKEQRRQ